MIFLFIREYLKVCFFRSIFIDHSPVPSSFLGHLSLECPYSIPIYESHILLDSLFIFDEWIVHLGDPAHRASI
jgi:hypothetical protein